MSDDNNNLIPWNPAHFGHVDFKKESDGQLTIFFEDTNEPPDPDDFANLEAYEIAWIEWEQTQTLPQQEDKIMNFNITTSFDSEIEQLKAKLAELETQKHRISTCANRIVAQVGECVTEMKQVGVSDEILATWACVIYKEITGQGIPALSDSDVLMGAVANQKLTEEVLELRGESPHIILINGEWVKNVVQDSDGLTETQTKESEEDPRQNSEFLEAINNQEIVSEFLRKLDRITRVDKLDWRKIRELPLSFETMRELGLQINPKSKIHKYLLEQMPAMCAKYIEETGDNSDLDWLPGYFVDSVREALNESVGETKSPQPEIKPVFQRGDIVCLIANPSSPSTILDINGEWVNVVQDSDGLTDMWNISDICHLVAE